MLLMSPWLLLVVTGDGSINFGLFFFLFYVCLNYPAQCAYVLMLLLPSCIQRGHIDPQITQPPLYLLKPLSIGNPLH